jgi:hypothetical protein
MVVLSFVLTGIVCSQGFAAFLLERKASRRSGTGKKAERKKPNKIQIQKF